MTTFHGDHSLRRIDWFLDLVSARAALNPFYRVPWVDLRLSPKSANFPFDITIAS